MDTVDQFILGLVVGTVFK